MDSLWNDLSQLTVGYKDELKTLLRVAVLLFVGLPLVFWGGRLARRRVSRLFTSQHGLIAGKAVVYLGIGAILVALLNLLGFPLTHLTGAAGIVGLAVGFASQTSVSNVISGIFLVSERPFVVGDIIHVGDYSGEILSVDTLSLKLRTFDNKLVRIPNETLIKSEVTNVTYFPIRRMDLEVGVAYKEDLKKVREVLMQAAERTLRVLREPKPLFILKGFGSSSVDIQFSVWAAKQEWLDTRTEVTQTIKELFDQAGIEIPFPHLSLYKGVASEPIPIRVVEGEGLSREETQTTRD